LRIETQSWRTCYARHCNAKYRALMHEALRFIGDVSKRLDRPINDLSDVRLVVDTLCELRGTEIDFDMTIAPIEVMPALSYTVITTGPSRSTAGPGETFSRGLSGENFFEFFFSKWCILVYFIFLRDGGARNVAEPGVAYPYPLPPLDGPVSQSQLAYCYRKLSVCLSSLSLSLYRQSIVAI